jgi:hypothetical protein
VSAHTSSTRRIVERAALLVVLGGLTGFASSADAQTTTREPQRAFRGLFGGRPTPDPNRTRQELSLTANVVGGYDDNLAASAGGGGAQPGSESPGGYLGTGEVALKYYRGRLIRSFAIDGNVFVTKYGENSGVGLVEGGSFNLSATTQARRRDRVSVVQHVNYQPLLTLGSFSALDPVLPAGGAPETSTFAGLQESRSLGSQSGLDYQWSMSRRNALGLNYGFQTQRYLDIDTAQGNSQSHRAGTAYTRTLSRNLGMRAAYNYSYGRFHDVDGVRPLTQQTIEGGPDYTKTLSRTRRVQLAASVGSQYVRTLSSVALRRTLIDYWTPFASASASVDLATNWDVRGDYRRSTVVMPEVTTESYVGDAVTVGTSTLVGERLDLDLTVGLATGTSAVATGSNATYRTSSIATTAHWALARRFAVLLNYYYYDYQFTNTADLPEGFNPSTRRHTVRVGITVWLPLLGNYIESRGAGRP